MSNDTAPLAPRSLFPSSASTGSSGTLPSSRPATSRPAARTTPAPVFAPSVMPRQSSATTPINAGAPQRSDRAAPMHKELVKPLSEVIARRGATEFSDVFRDLVVHGASDVHMTQSVLDGTFTVEARVDGRKQLVHVYEGVEATTISTLLKTQSGILTGSNLAPMDGSYNLPIDGYPYRARAVRLPLFDGGDRMVLRLPQTGRLRTLYELGFTDTNLAATTDLLDNPSGMTLLAGPTGEGKSTTALGSLMYLRDQDDGVIYTLEDPVERIIPGISQIEVNESIDGARFGDMMKFIVRADPNVLFIGEIRDTATATAAVEIAKSGRRVIATIHAKDNIGALLRLISMAEDNPLSVLESINGVVSQRLVPRLVPGTDRFSGRYPIHEVTANSDQLTDALIESTSRTHIHEAAAATSTTFKDTVAELVADGITTLAAARKVIKNV